MQFEIWKRDTSSFVLFFSRLLLDIWSLSCFHTNFRIVCFTFVKKKKAIGILIGIVPNLYFALGIV